MSDPQPANTTPSFPFGRVLTFLTVWLGGSLGIIGFAVGPRLPGGWFTVAGLLAVLTASAFIILQGLGGRFYPSRAMRLFVGRPFWYALFFLPLLAVVALVGLLAGAVTPWGQAAAQWTVGVGAVAMGLAIIAGYIGSRRLVVRRLTVTMPRLPPAFEGLRVVQISDLHVGPHTPRRHLARVARNVMQARPDLIVSTGDQVDDFARDVTYFGRAFGDLAAPLGVFAIAGNHDVYAGWDAVRQGLGALGIRVLVNHAVPLERDGERLWLAATGDPAGGDWTRGGGGHAAPDIAKTLSSVPSGEPVLVLAHNPVLWSPLAERGADLVLSGHTHYGQVAFPRWNWNVASPFATPSMGFHREGDSLLYINPGTNFWGIPFRIGTPPEVTVLTLERGAEAGIEDA